MMESKVFADNFSRSFSELGDFFQFLSARQARSKWMTAPSKELRFEPVERGSTLGNLYMQIYDHNGDADVLEDTMENTSLLLKVDLQYGDDFQMLEVQNSEDAAQLVIKNYLREVAIHGIENVQILSPFRKRGAVASNALNETLRDLVNPPNNLKKEVKCGGRVFRVGDRIMQTVNRINVSNGDVGIISDMEKEDDETIVCVKLLDGRELRYTQEMLEDLEFSYCTTIHKSQGQEYPVIIVPLLKEHYIMLRRNLLYTAVTRAKAKVILIGQKQAVFIAIHKCDVGQRNTVLADRIVAYYNRELSNRVT